MYKVGMTWWYIAFGEIW